MKVAAAAMTGHGSLVREPGSAHADGGLAERPEHCDLCGIEIPADHRHLLHLEERRIACVCDAARCSASTAPGARRGQGRLVSPS